MWEVYKKYKCIHTNGMLEKQTHAFSNVFLSTMLEHNAFFYENTKWRGASSMKPLLGYLEYIRFYFIGVDA